MKKIAILAGLALSCGLAASADAQLIAELAAVGFSLDPSVPFTEYNRPKPGMLQSGTPPVIYEAGFRRVD